MTYERIRKECSAVKGRIRGEHADAFAKWYFDKGFGVTKNGGVTFLRNDLIAKYQEWRTAGLDKPDGVHQLTRAELAEVVKRMNASLDETNKISAEAESDFWNYAVGENFKRRNGDLLTEKNVGRTLAAFCRYRRDGDDGDDGTPHTGKGGGKPKANGNGNGGGKEMSDQQLADLLAKRFDRRIVYEDDL